MKCLQLASMYLADEYTLPSVLITYKTFDICQKTKVWHSWISKGQNGFYSPTLILNSSRNDTYVDFQNMRI